MNVPPYVTTGNTGGSEYSNSPGPIEPFRRFSEKWNKNIQGAPLPHPKKNWTIFESL